MTIETCKRLMEHCLKMKDEAGAAMYAARIKRKEARQGITPEVKKSGKK